MVAEQLCMETILIADDHELIRRGIRTIIEGFSQPYNLIEASTCAEVIQVLSTQQVHYAVLEMLLAGENIFSTAWPIMEYIPQTETFVYSINPEKLYARRLMQKGIRGYLCKQASLEELEIAIRSFLKGETYVSASLKDTISLPARAGLSKNPIDALSDRELEVVEYLVTGMGANEIARLMGLGVTTVSTYCRRVFRKLQVDNIIDLRDRFLLLKM
jgi:two-component system invasion response regulator UvrY